MARRRKKTGRLGSLLLIVLLLLAAWVYTKLPEQPQTPDVPAAAVEGEVTVHVIDVGQADAILIVAPDGNMLIDAGLDSSEDELAAYLDLYGIEAFEYVVFTHPDADHIGGADMIMREYEVEAVILPNAVKTTIVYENMISAIEQSDAQVIEAISGESYAIGELTFRILAPNEQKYANTNDYSVVLRATYGAVSMMFTGDAMGNSKGVSEDEMLSTYRADELKSDFLKVGHHGSDTSTSPEFLAAVAPKLAAISAGEGNSYGHPHKSVLDALSAAGVTYYCTHERGSLVFVCDGESIVYQQGQ